jgi:serine/threonine protein kinase
LVFDHDLPDSLCKIADFGRVLEVAGTSVPREEHGGTPGFTVPKCIGGYGDFKSDIYACGKVTLWLRTGSTLSGEEQSLESILRYLQETYPKKDMIQGSCADIIAKMLNNSAPMRPNTEEYLQIDWIKHRGLATRPDNRYLPNLPSIYCDPGTSDLPDTDPVVFASSDNKAS